MISHSSSQWYPKDTRSGRPTVILNGKAVHSRFDPVREADKAVECISGDGIDIVVLAGFGLGYVAESIVKKFPHSRLIVADADEDALARSLKVRNLDKLLAHPVLSFMLGGNPADIKEFLTGGPVGAGIHFFPWRPAMHVNPDWYASLEHNVAVTAHHRQINAHTLEKFGRLWVKNLVFNRSILTRAISLDKGLNVFADMPALILAGGPSLEDCLPHLQQLARRFLIIAVDTALRAALRMDVVPDVIVSVDPQYWNSRHLDWCKKHTQKTLLVAEAAAHPTVFRGIDGPCMLMRTRFPLGTVFENAVGLKGELMAGGSVATAAWDLARHYGCCPIVAVGLDLGYPNLKTHYNGSLSRELPHTASTRLNPSQHAFHQALKSAHPRKVRDMAGRPLITDARMDVYHTWFTECIKKLADRNPAVLGNKGRFIEGMRVISIEELLEIKEQRNELNRRMDNLKQISPSPSAKESLDRVSTRLIEALQYMIQVAQQGIIETKAAQALINNINSIEQSERFQRHMNKLAELDKELMSGEGLEVVSFLLQPLILSITSSARNQKTDPLLRSLYLYNEIQESASLHLEFLKMS